MVKGLCYYAITLKDEKEIDWLNNYHTMVYDKLNTLLDNEEKVWLKEKTKRI